MLFDLRGSGRRRTVKIVYVTLAILMGGGLVLFGIGGSGALPGGLLDAVTESSGSGDDGTDRLRDAERQASAATQRDPDDPEAYAALARARFNLANVGENIDQNTGFYTDAGAAQLQAAGRAWERHVELAGDSPNLDVARVMVQAYGALGDFGAAADAQELVAEDVDTASTYVTLAQLAYSAGETRKGDLAADRAIQLTEPDMREALRGQLDTIKQESTQQQIQDAIESAPSATPDASATPSPSPEGR